MVADATRDPRGEGRTRAPLPARIARFRVVQALGAGANGVVYAAVDERLDRTVAIKRIPRVGPRGRARIVREARALAKLNHPNVVSIYEVGEDGDALFIAMEYVRGQTLQALHAQRPGWRSVLKAHRAAGRGLVAAHAAGLVHRDFKPANVVVSDAGEVKVLDFGLVRSQWDGADTDGRDPASADPRVTRAGTVVGTPAYMAPEQFADADVDAAADQFSFCVGLFEGLYGFSPFAGDTIFERQAAIAAGDVASRPADSDVPRWLHAVLVRGLRPDPAHRWPSMEALLNALRGPAVARRGPWIGAAVALVSLLGLGLGLRARGWVDEAARCSGASDRIAEVWGPSQRDAIRAAFDRTALPYATAAAGRVTADLDRYATTWTDLHTAACQRAGASADGDETDLDLQMACLGRARAALQDAVSLLAEGTPDTVRNADRVTAALADLPACEDLETLKQDARRGIDLASGSPALSAVGLALASGEPDRAERALRAAEAEIRERPDPAFEVQLEFNRAMVRLRRGEFPAGETSLRHALDLATRRGDAAMMRQIATRLLVLTALELGHPARARLEFGPLVRPEAEPVPLLRSEMLHALAVLAYIEHDYGEAVRLHQEALALRLAAPGNNDYAVYQSRNNLAAVLRARGDAAAAGELYRANEAYARVLGPSHPEAAVWHLNYALALADLDRREEARQHATIAEQTWAATFAPDYHHLTAAREMLALLAMQDGQTEVAIEGLTEVLRARQRSLGPDHPRVANAYNNLGAALAEGGRIQEAEEAHRAALAIRETVLGSDSVETATSRTNLAAALLALGRTDEVAVIADALAWDPCPEAFPAYQCAANTYVAGRARWFQATDAAGRAEAVAVLRRALTLYEQSHDPRGTDAVRRALTEIGHAPP